MANSGCYLEKGAGELKLRREYKIRTFVKKIFSNGDTVPFNLNEELLSSVNGMIIAHKSLMNKAEAIESDVLRIQDSMEDVQAFVKSVIGVDKKKFSEDEANLLTQRIKRYTESMVAAGLDPHAVIDEASVSPGYKHMVDRMTRSNKGDMGFKGLGKHLPKLFKTFLVNRTRFFRKFRPAAEVIHKRNLLRTYMLTSRNNFIESTQKLLSSAANNYQYKEADINRLLPLLNGYDSRQDINPDAGNESTKEKNRMIIAEFKNKLSAYGDVDKSEIDTVTANFLKIKLGWDSINYGIRYMTGKQDTPDDNSIVGFYTNSLRMYSGIYNEREKYISSTVPGYEIDSIERKLNQMGIEKFHFRNGYVPGQGELPFNLVGSNNFANKFPRLASILHAQDQSADRTNFEEGFIDGIMDFTFKLETVAQLSTLGAIQGSLNKYVQWGKQNPAVKGIIKHYADEMWKFTTAHNKSKASTEILRNLFHPLTMMSGPLMLLYPASGITNVVAGKLAIGLKFGSELRSVTDIYHKALDNPSHDDNAIAVAVQKIAKEQFLDVGTIQDFQIQKTAQSSGKGGLVDFSRDVHDGIMKITDATTRKGLLGIMGLTDSFSLKNTEEKRLRNTIAPLLFDQAQIEYHVMKANGMLPKDKSVAEVVADILEKSGETVHDDLNQALGNFDQDNKPFWTWMPIHSSSSVKVALGSLANAWYMFKHVGVNNTYLMKDVGAEINPFKMKGKGDAYYRDYLSKLNTPGGGSLAIVLLIAGYRAMSALMGITGIGGGRKKSMMISSLVRNINPLQEVQTMSELAGALLYKSVLAPLTNMKVNQKEFEFIVRENLQLAGGVLAGGALEDIIEKQQADRPMYNIFMDGLANNVLAIDDAFSADSYVERRKAVFEILNNPSPLTNYSNDYVNLASKMILQFSKVSEDEEDADTDERRKGQDLLKMFTTIFGLNMYSHPTLWENYTVGKSYKFSYALERLQAQRERSGFNDLDEELYTQMIKYKRVYINSMLKRMVQGE